MANPFVLKIFLALDRAILYDCTVKNLIELTKILDHVQNEFTR